MRLLFLSPYVPSLIRVRPYNFVRALSRRGNQVTLLALQPPGDAAEALSELQTLCEMVEVVPHPRLQTLINGLQALPSSMPLQAAYSRSTALAARARRLAAQARYDAVHIEHLRGAVLAEALPHLPAVFDSVDSISLLFSKVLQDAPSLKSRLMAWLDLGRTRRFEGALTQRFDQVTVTSDADRRALIELGCDDARVTVIPNGVDLDYFSPLPTPRDPLRIVFTGKMSYHANVAAAEDLVNAIMPRVWAEMPNVHLDIVGKDPSPTVQAFSERPQVTVTGFVLDMRPYLARAAIAVSPVRYGVGIQNKVLEAMAMRTPVVCSPQACSALQARHGDELLVGETPEAIARHLLDLLRSPQQRERLGESGRRYVETHHSWDSAAAALERLYQAAINRRQQTAASQVMTLGERRG